MRTASLSPIAVASTVVLLSPMVYGQETEATTEPVTTISYQDGGRIVELTLINDVVLAQNEKQGRYLKTVDPEEPRPTVSAATDDGQSLPMDVPVFKTNTGQLLAPVGGVILVLHPSWTGEDCTRFLDGYGLDAKQFELLTNAYLVDTEPGMPSIELSNRLSSLEGVVIVAPNFWREVEER